MKQKLKMPLRSGNSNGAEQIKNIFIQCYCSTDRRILEWKFIMTQKYRLKK